MLQILNVNETFGKGAPSLENISLDFPDTGLVLLVGPAGAGKTTLLNIITGMVKPTSGSVLLDGADVLREKGGVLDRYRKFELGVVPQQDSLIPYLSVAENVQLDLEINGENKAQAHKRAVEFLARCGLAEIADVPAGQLSAGKAQQTAIARACVGNPRILIADDPFKSLDTQAMRETADILQYAARERLVIAAIGDENAAALLNGRVICMQNGRIVSDSAPFTATPPAVKPAGAKVAAASGAAGSAGAHALSEGKRPKNTEKTSKSSLVSLAMRDISQRKGRLALTVLGGFIGVFAIAFILALTNGAGDTITKQRDDILRAEPISITKTTFNSELLDDIVGTGKNDTDQNPAADGKRRLTVRNEIANSLNTTGDLDEVVHRNELDALKEHIDKNNSRFNAVASSIDYDYSVDPQLYASDTSSGVNQVYPRTNLTTLGITISGIVSKFLGAGVSTSVFAFMPSEKALFEDSYDVLAGTWPTKPTEAVIVLNQNETSLNDYMLYQLGILDYAELNQMMQDFYDGKTVKNIEHSVSITYEDLLKCSFKLVDQAAMYQYNGTYNTWIDMSRDEDFMRGLVDSAESVNVVGVVQYSGKGPQSLTAGINLPHALNDYSIENSLKYDVVQNQLNNPDIDVFTGKPFDSEITWEDLRLGSIINFNEDAVFDALDTLIAALNLPEVSLSEDIIAAWEFDWDSDFTIESLGLTKADIDSIYKDVALDLSDMPEPDVTDLTIPKANIAAANQKAFDLLNGYLTDIATYNSDGIVTDIRSISADELWWFITSGEFKDEIFRTYMTSLSPTYEQMAEIDDWYDDELADFLYDAGTDVIDDVAGNLTTMLVEAINKLLNTSILTTLENILRDSGANDLASAIHKIAEAIEAGGVDFDAILSILGDLIKFKPVDNGITESDLEDALFSILSLNYSVNDFGGLLTILLGGGDDAESNLEALGYVSPDTPSEISVYTESYEDRQKLVALFNDYNEEMKKQGKTELLLQFSDVPGSLVEPITGAVKAIGVVLALPTVLAFLVFLVMMCVIAMFTVSNWKKEIGILRQLGASKNDITFAMLTENTITGVLVGVSGVLVAQLAGLLLGRALSGVSAGAVFLLSFGQALGIILVSVLIALIAGLIPSLRAIRTAEKG